MEAMVYNYFSPTPQSYGYLGFDAESGILPTDGLGATPSVEDVNAGNSTGSYDFNAFDAAISPRMTPHLQQSGSVSPPPQQLPSFRNASMDGRMGLDMDHDRARRNSSEEKDNLTPAQSRRKAQNRAAQRAFRERKERHVKEIEAKLNLLATTTSTLQFDNERLKLLLQRAQSENEILRATATHPPIIQHPLGFVDDPSLLAPSNQPKPSPLAEEPHLNPTRLANGLLSTGHSSPGFGSSPGSDGHLLSASATWDLLQSHPLYLSGAVDIGEVCERLKELARCEGMGPMFEEKEVRKVIEEVGRRGSDELI